MGFVAKDSGGGGAFKRTPAGVYIGRCYSLIDLGTQTKEYQGETKMVREIRLGFELFGEDEQGNPLTVTVDGKEMPMTISKRYTLSLHKKASLRRDLAAWRGKDFTEEEAKGFDVSRLVNSYCMVNCSETESNGKTYTNISGLTPLPAALKNSKPKAVHAAELFDVDSPDMELFATFYEGLQTTIRQCAEWKNGGKGEAQPAAQGVAELDEDVPF